MLCNVGQGFPSAMSFRTYHLLHHSHLDEYAYDADLAFRLGGAAGGNSPLRKAVWLFLFAAIEIIRPLRVKRPFTDRWSVLNTAVIVVTDFLIWWWCGCAGWPTCCSRPSPASACTRSVRAGSRSTTRFTRVKRRTRTTASSTGIAFNIGYHNEHHDLVKVPWVHLPKVKAIAPEFYDHLHAHRSWTRVLLQFLFDPQHRPLHAHHARSQAESRGRRHRHRGRVMVG